MGTWIYKIAVNTCLGALRKDKKNNQINENSLPEVAQMEDDNHRELQLNKMFKCIDKLNTNNKAIILLELEDIPQATIAEVHGLTHGSLRTRLNRIRKSLLKCITNE